MLMKVNVERLGNTAKGGNTAESNSLCNSTGFSYARSQDNY